MGDIKAVMLDNSEHWREWQSHAGAVRTAYYTGPIDDTYLLTPIANFKSDIDGIQAFSSLCLARQRHDLIVIVQSELKKEQAKIAIAKLCLFTAEMPAESWLDPNNEHSTFQGDERLQGLVSDAGAAVDALETYASSERPGEVRPDEEDDLRKVIECSKKEAQDGRDIIGLNISTLQSRWLDTMQTIQNALAALTPPDWRKYTIEVRDDAKIMSEIVDNEPLALLLPKLDALTVSETVHTAMLSAIKKSSTLDVEPVMTEGKLLIAVRALCTVTLRKLPLAQTARSKAATTREARKLVKEIDVVVPSVLFQRMDDATV